MAKASLERTSVVIEAHGLHTESIYNPHSSTQKIILREKQTMKLFIIGILKISGKSSVIFYRLRLDNKHISLNRQLSEINLPAFENTKVGIPNYNVHRSQVMCIYTSILKDKTPVGKRADSSTPFRLQAEKAPTRNIFWQRIPGNQRGLPLKTDCPL